MTPLWINELVKIHQPPLPPREGWGEGGFKWTLTSSSIHIPESPRPTKPGMKVSESIRWKEWAPQGTQDTAFRGVSLHEVGRAFAKSSECRTSRQPLRPTPSSRVRDHRAHDPPVLGARRDDIAGPDAAGADVCTWAFSNSCWRAKKTRLGPLICERGCDVTWAPAP